MKLHNAGHHGRLSLRLSSRLAKGLDQLPCTAKGRSSFASFTVYVLPISSVLSGLRPADMLKLSSATRYTLRRKVITDEFK